MLFILMTLSPQLKILLPILGVVLLILLYVIRIQRALVRLCEMTKNAMGQIAVQMNSRWDALTQLAKVTAGYAKHEHDTLLEIIQARRGDLNRPTVQSLQEQSVAAQSVLDRLFALAESYPDLKANAVYQDLMASVERFENHVRMQRMVYNDAATRLNNLVKMFPSNLIARMLGVGTADYFQAEEGKTSMPDLQI